METITPSQPFDILKFLRGEITDFKGRTLKELQNLSFQELEECHDHIQQMFPTDIPSNHSKYTHVLTQEEIDIIKNDDIIQKNIYSSFIHFCRFLIQNNQWITSKNHNFLRITRVLRFLWLCEREDLYDYFQKLLNEIYEKNKEIIGEETYQYWKNANNIQFLLTSNTPKSFIPFIKCQDGKIRHIHQVIQSEEEKN